MHQFERVIDFIQIHLMSREFVNHQFSSQVLINKLGNCITTFPSTKCRSFPNPASYQLERTSRYLLASGCYPDYDRLAPAFVTGF
jgi:hypothetical protein